MDIYKKMYEKMFSKLSEVILELEELQKECERLYLAEAQREKGEAALDLEPADPGSRLEYK